MFPVIIMHLLKTSVQEEQLKLDFGFKKQLALSLKCGVLQELVIPLTLG